MEFKIFLDTYPIASWLWELFKGVSPLIVAIITIWINGNRENNKIIQLQKKQDEINLLEKNKAKYNELKNDIDYIVDKVMDLNVIIWDSAKDILKMMQSIDSEEDEYFNSFIEKNIKMHILSRKINSYVDIKIAYHEVKGISFSSVLKDIRDYADSLEDIIESQSEKADRGSMGEEDKLLDQNKKKLSEASQKAEDSLVSYSIALNNVLKESAYYKAIQ